MLKTSCLPCHTDHRKCIPDPNRAQPCDRCLRNGRACQYEGSPPFPPRRKTCSLCKKEGRKCVAGIDDQPCNRCIRTSSQCIYLTVTSAAYLEPIVPGNPLPQVNELSQNVQSDGGEAMDAGHIELLCAGDLSSSSNQTTLETNPFLDLYTHTMESTHLYSFESFEMEDIDLLPTQEDWRLVYNFYTRDTVLPCERGLDATALVNEYFHKPAYLRLILVCWAFFCYNHGRLNGAGTYFNRARKALLRANLTPCFDLLITYGLIDTFASVKGDVIIGQQFLRLTLELISQLRMDVDPDDSPWLSHLTARQKEERRHAFWHWTMRYNMQLSCNPHQPMFPISFDRVKCPSQIYDPYPIFIDMTPFYYRFRLWNTLGSIKQAWINPPRTVNDLFLTVETLTFQVLNVHALIPPELLLTAKVPTNISQEDRNLFITQITTNRKSLCYQSLLLQSSISTLYRPAMFAAALPSCRPIYLDTQHQSNIVYAINACMESAWRMLLIFEFAYDVKTEQRCSADDMVYFHTEGSYFAAFETVVCFWFCACRMDLIWVTLTKFGNPNSNLFRQRLMRLLGPYKDVTMGDCVIEPLVETMKLMLDEMEEVEGQKERRSVNELFSREGTREVGIAGDTYFGALQSYANATVTETFCYLGLLGFNVGNNVRWPGRSEDSWRLFWKLNS